ncbi:hypothetical protein [Ligilactobacillus murinus]|nr:hypothetical protein [Ligilactobacillus murinus]MCR1879945.1 hypothetical protein [Ligilactobacillus murinus]
MIIFGNFEELQNNDEKLANELLQERGAGEWQAEEIYYSTGTKANNT